MFPSAERKPNFGIIVNRVCQKNYTVSYGIVKISELDVPQPDSGNYGLVTSNGFGCFETEFIDIDQGSFLEMQYLSTDHFAWYKKQQDIFEGQC
ncbi:hypothetical protein MTP99_016725 [Tenebrio molitor]|nr:hypothetical protein MTP99_016725 [Tenebrio molitor]